MAKNFIQNGDAIHITATSPIQGGELVELGDLHGIAIADIAQNEIGAVSVIGVWEFKAKSTDNITQGATVYWDNGAKEVTATKSSNKVLGIAWSNSPNTQTTVQVKINA